MADYLNTLAAFGSRPSLGQMIDERRALNSQTNYRNLLGQQVQSEMAGKNTLRELYGQYASGDEAALQKIASVDPSTHMAIQKNQQAQAASQRELQEQQAQKLGRMAIWANDEQKWSSTPWGQKGVPFDQREQVLGQYIGYGDTLKTVQDMNKQPEAIQTLETLKARPDLLAIKTGLTRAGAPNTQVQIKQDTKEGEAVGKFYGEEFANLQLGARKARQNNAKLDRLEQMFATATPGRLAPLANNMKAWAQGAGIDLESIGVTDTTSEADSIAAITNQMALALRNPAGGEGMPGALSDKDRDFLMASVPGLQKTPGGNQKIIEYMRRMNNRSIEEAAMAREYRKRYGSLDETFYDLLDEYAQNNPIFPEAQDIVNQNAAPSGNLSDIPTEQLIQMLDEGGQ